jgi:hypothetical protein
MPVGGGSLNPPPGKMKKPFGKKGLSADGGPYWARTSDLFHVKETL